MKKKILSLLMVGALTASLFAGCGKKGSSATDYSSTIDMEEDPYTVAIQVVVLPGTDYSAFEENLEAAINEISLKEVNCKCDIQFTNIAELVNTTQMAVAAGKDDKIDIVAACTVMPLSSLVGKEILLDMNEGGLLDKRGAELKTIFADVLKSGEVDGQQLAIPANVYNALETGIYYNKTVADAAGITLPETGTFADVEAALYALHEVNPDIRCHHAGSGNLLYLPFFYGIDTFGDNAKYGAILDAEKDATVVNVFETEMFKDFALTMFRWHRDGLIKENDTSDETPTQTYIASGDAFMTCASLNPEQRANYAGTLANSGYEIGFMTLTSPKITTSSISEYMWGIAASCERPDKAMDFLNLLYTNADVANILKYGIEGENYFPVEGSDTTIAMNYSYFPLFYRGGDVNIMKNTAGDEFIADTKAFEASASISPILGYLFVDEDYQTESVVIANAIAEYMPKLQAGLFNSEEEVLAYLDAFNKALNDAGIQDVIAGNQEQLNAFLGK